MQSNKLAITGLLAVSLAGCGGGGSSEKSNPFVVTTTDTVTVIDPIDETEVVVVKGTATISWTAPTHNDDATEENPEGTLLTNLAGFRIYYGDFPGEYPIIIPITNIGLSSYFIDDLDQGDWFFVMTAYNTYGRESNPSIELHKEIK